MAQHILKNTFTRGEISPLAEARNDIQLYQQSAASLLNWMVMKEGGLTRRPGTYYCGATKAPDEDIRLVDFVFNSTQSYVLEFGDIYVRFWTSGAQITYLGSPYEIVSPYPEAALRDITWIQSNDTLVMAYASMTIKPQLLQRTSHTSWAFSDVEFVDGPYLPINDQDNIVTSDIVLATNTTATFTFASVTGINKGAGFVSTDVDRHFRVQFNGKWSWGIITAVNSTTEIEVDIKEGNGGGGPGSASTAMGGSAGLSSVDETKEPGSTNVNPYESLSWRLGAFSDTTGYPGSVSYYQGRIVWGRTDNDPRAVWYSRSNLPFIMSPSDVDGTVTSSHGGMLEIIGARADEVLWLQEAPRLQIGTASTIRSLGASSGDDQFGPRNVSQRSETSHGVSSVRPAVVGGSTVHAARFGKGLHDLFYDFQVNSLVAPELSIVSDHMFKRQIREVVFQQIPNKTLWAVLESGTLCATTIERYEKVVGFSRHTVGGTVISLCAIPGDGSDDLYMVVRRTVNGSTVQYMEILGDRFDGDLMEKADAHFSDCGGVYEGAATNTVTGITWLPNTEVAVLADGAVMPDATISGAGVLTLPTGRTASTIHFGLAIEARGKPLRVPVALPDGSGLGRKCRVVDVIVDVYETLGLQFESDTGTVDDLRLRGGSDLMGQSPPLATGTKQLILDGSWESDGQYEFVAAQPLPATIRAINTYLETE